MVMPECLNLPKWLKENGHLLQPPINNYCVYRGGFTIMVVGGPNERTDYHINETPEFFFQYKGGMVLKIVDTETGEFKDVEIDEGSMFLLPPNTPHSPQRFANTVGIVVEQDRPSTSLDKMRWYCPNKSCRKIVYEAAFHCTDLGTQVKQAVIDFDGDINKRTCKVCGTVATSK